MRMILAELRKVWTQRAVLIALLVLLMGNMFLLWVSTRPSPYEPPPSAYRLLTQELQPLTMPQRVEYIETLHSTMENLVIVESILSWEAQDRQTGQAMREEYADVMQEYEPLYLEGNFLRYTGTAQQELRFLSIIRQELETVCGYEGFLEEIDRKAMNLSQISIFAEAGSYDQRNIQTTAAAFKNMSGIVIDYLPQKGFYTAVNFAFTDVFAFLSMLVFASVLVRGEKDSSLLGLIRSTAAGRAETALAKLAALAVSILGVLLVLYGANLLFCASFYGLGNFGRSIQSLPFLMRSTLKLNMFHYSALFFVIKWACAFVAGTWVLLATLWAKKAITGYLLATLAPAASVVLYGVVSATGVWNILKYANLAGLMQTNHILGRYHNLYWFGHPAPLWLVALLTASLLVVLFVVPFVLLFQYAELMPATKRGRLLPSFFTKGRKHKFSSRIFTYETYKTLLMNGAVWALGAICAFQIVAAYQNSAHIGPEEIYYRYYMSHLEGPLTREKYLWLSEEAEKFEPMLQLQNEVIRGEISVQQYETVRTVYQGLEMEYQVYLRVLEQYDFVLNNPPAQFVYDTGYPELFGLQQDVDMRETAVSALAIILCCCGVFATEKSTRMNRVLHATPLGRETTAHKKLLLAVGLSAIVAALSIAPKLYKAIVGYGLGNLTAPLFSLQEYRGVPTFIPIVALLAFAVLARFVACFGLSIGVLLFSAKTGNSTIAMLTGLLAFCVSPLLYFIGLGNFKWLSAYPLFHLPALMVSGSSALLATLIFFAWLLWGCLGAVALNREWCGIPQKA